MKVATMIIKLIHRSATSNFHTVVPTIFYYTCTCKYTHLLDTSSLFWPYFSIITYYEFKKSTISCVIINYNNFFKL